MQDGQGQAAQAVAVVAQEVRLGRPPMVQAQVGGGLPGVSQAIAVVAPQAQVDGGIAVVAPVVRRDGGLGMDYSGRANAGGAANAGDLNIGASSANVFPGGLGNASAPQHGARADVGEDRIAAGEAAETAKATPDVPRSLEDEIRGADGEYPSLPAEHQISYNCESFDAPRPCLFGGAKHVADSEEWKRLEISAQERAWKSCVSPNFRVVKNHEPNTCRHLYHAGPHVSMVFDITQQNTPEAGLNPRS
jgi:hypothetical protein